MPLLPINPTDTFETLGRSLTGAANTISGVFNNSISAPSSTTSQAQGSFSTRQSRVKNEKIATSTRKMMRWLVPERPLVEMYINPQNVSYNYSKAITETRTKGGYTVQYWGEQITNLAIQGTTGTSGIEGINVLYDVYRNEQLMFDPYALFLQSQQELDQKNELLPQSLSNNGDLGSIADTITNLLTNGDNGIPISTRSRPSLASLAFTVELYWSGEVYRGYFKDFQVTENVNNLGMFDYSINFRVTQKRGFRNNYLGWHRSANNGPSNSNAFHGTPHSFSALSTSSGTPQRNNVDQPRTNVNFIDSSKQNGLNLIGGISGVVNNSVSALLNAFDI